MLEGQGRRGREGWAHPSESHMTRGSDHAVSRTCDKCIMSGRRPPRPPLFHVDGFWEALPFHKSYHPRDPHVSSMWVGGPERHMPLIPYLLCTGLGFLFLGNLASAGSKLHTCLKIGPPREHGGQCSGDKHPRLSGDKHPLRRGGHELVFGPSHLSSCQLDRWT